MIDIFAYHPRTSTDTPPENGEDVPRIHVVRKLAEKLRVLEIGPRQEIQDGFSMVAVEMRIEMASSELNSATPIGATETHVVPTTLMNAIGQFFGVPQGFSSGQTRVIVPSNQGLPVFCPTCTTIPMSSLEAVIQGKGETCERQVRRGGVLHSYEVDCVGAPVDDERNVRLLRQLKIALIVLGIVLNGEYETTGD